MGKNATSYAFINPQGKIETFIKMDLPEAWSPPEGYYIIPDDELPPNLEQQPEIHDLELVRNERNKKLKDSDWTQVNDSPVDKQLWSIYRQALRDLLQNYNGVGPVPWPIAPQ